MSMSQQDYDKWVQEKNQKEQEYNALVYQAIFGTKPNSPPFGAWRYQQGGQGTGMQVQQNSSGGLVSSGPQNASYDSRDPNRDDSQLTGKQLRGLPQPDVRSSLALNMNSGGLTDTSKRERDQNTIQGDLSTTQRTLSATAVARQLGAQGVTELQGDSGLWEWLHLVAFSIGPSHVLGLSDASRQWLGTSEQTAQITENLILGTKEANTAMLTFETGLKKFLQLDPSCSVTLAVYTTGIKYVDVPSLDARVPVARALKFDYFFVVGPNQVTAPASLTFDLFSHSAPSFAEFDSMYQEMAKNFARQVAVPHLPQKMGTGLDPL